MRFLLRIPDAPRNGPLLAGRKARNFLGTSIVLSGLRCLVTYLAIPLLAPSLGSIGAVSGGAGVALGALAVVFSVRSMRGFWAAGHRHRWKYSIFAFVVIGWVIVDLTLSGARAFR